MRLRFGCLTGQLHPFQELLDKWLFLERLGFDHGWLFDHFKPEFAPDVPWLECWTTLAALAASTSRIRLGTAVTNAALRNPAILCKQAVTVDQVSGGRLDLAIGAGYYESEQRMLGLEYPKRRGRAERLSEVVEVLSRGLCGDNVTLDGRYWKLTDVPMSPGSVQQPRAPIWVDVAGPISIRAAAQHADAVITLGDLDDELLATMHKLKDRFAVLTDTCHRLGRNTDQMRKAYLVGWSAERPYGSEGEFVDFVGRFSELGVTDFVMAIFQIGGRAELEAVAGWIAGLHRGGD